MKDILFRGQRLEPSPSFNDDINDPDLKLDMWVYGDLVTLYYPKKTINIAIEGDNHNWANTEFIEVDPATVGQYTGLKDNAGARIFERDIVDAFHFGLQEHVKYKIVFEDGVFKGLRHPKRMAEDATVYWLSIYGTVAENPELLETNNP